MEERKSGGGKKKRLCSATGFTAIKSESSPWTDVTGIPGRAYAEEVVSRR